MLLNSLEKILINYKNKSKIIEFVMKYNKGEFIYPSALQEYLETTDKDTYNVLIKLCDNNFLQLNYILYCPYCDNKIGIYNDINKLSKEKYCGDCDKEFDPFQHTIVAFKVIK